MPRDDAAARPEVKIGDVVDVPRNADNVCTTRYRIRVTHISGYGVSGPRLRADLTPMVSRSVNSEDGLMTRLVPWYVVAKSHIIDGAAAR